MRPGALARRALALEAGPTETYADTLADILRRP